MKNKIYIPITSRRTSARLELSAIIRIRRERGSLIFTTVKGIYRMKAKFQDIEEYLDDRFFDVLAGWRINFQHVEWMAKGEIGFDDGEIFPVGRNNFLRARRAFDEWLRLDALAALETVRRTTGWTNGGGGESGPVRRPAPGSFPVGEAAECRTGYGGFRQS